MPSSLFATRAKAPKTVVNEAGGRAFALSDEMALAQYAVTGTFNSTFYATGKEQLEAVKVLAEKVSNDWLAKVIVYAAERGRLRDMPAFLLVTLATRAKTEHDYALFHAAARRVLVPGNGRVLRTFVQMAKSGQAGRKGLGSMMRDEVRRWLKDTPPEQLLSASVGEKPSLADIIKLVHPSPGGYGEQALERSALYRYLIGKETPPHSLPPEIEPYATFKETRYGDFPRVRFELATGLARDTGDWVTIAKNASWNQLRQNLNTFQRHGVFEHPSVVLALAQKLADPNEIKRARALPYGLLAAYTYMGDSTPKALRDALLSATDTALLNTPKLPGKTVVCVDLSGSMESSVTGQREGATSKVECRDAAALIAVALARANDDCEVIGFTQEAKFITGLEGNVLDVAQKLARAMSGGTDCSAPLRLIDSNKLSPNTVVMVSDNESWFGNGGYNRYGTTTAKAWERIAGRLPEANLVCIDLQPSFSVQVGDNPHVFNVGGFSDAVFDVLRAVASGEMSESHWHAAIDSIVLP
jgi:60 kDa SS-A/Ro ribonucleoprotein